MQRQKSSRRLPTYLRWILWVLLVQFILMNISAAFYAYRITHFYDDPSLLVYKPTKNIFAKTWKLFTGPKQGKSIIRDVPDFPIDTVHFHTHDGIPIEAWYSRADSAAIGTVILFHGITVSKVTVVAEAAEFRYLGYNVLLVDFRGHGNSGGHSSTVGYKESEEVKLAYDWVKQKGEKRVLIWGSSMGAVVVAKALYDYDIKPSGVILEMPFASLQSHLKARARVLGFPQQPFAFLVTFWIGVERGFNGFRHETSTYAAKIDCPVLLQWGSLDNYVLESETEKIYNAISSKQKKLVLYENASHESMLRNDPLKWRDAISGFLKSCP